MTAEWAQPSYLENLSEIGVAAKPEEMMQQTSETQSVSGLVWLGLIAVVLGSYFPELQIRGELNLQLFLWILDRLACQVDLQQVLRVDHSRRRSHHLNPHRSRT